MSQHGGNDLCDIPNYVEDLNNPELQAEYAMNRRHIVAGDEDTELKKVYNFPSNNLHRGKRSFSNTETLNVTSPKKIYCRTNF